MGPSFDGVVLYRQILHETVGLLQSSLQIGSDLPRRRTHFERLWHSVAGNESFRVANFGVLLMSADGMHTGEHIALHGRGVQIADVIAVARHGATAMLADDARSAMATSAALVEGFVASDKPVYGVTTGFGSLAATVIPSGRTAELQVALVRSHATGMGEVIEPEVVRAMLFLRARSLSMAYSGVRPELVDLQLAMLANNITPVVREFGSLGASGDLAPLSHCALALIGEGEVWTSEGTIVATGPVMAAAGLTPATLRAKEGLALINGTDGILAMLSLALHDLSMLMRLADVTAAMTVEGLLATDRAYADDLQQLRPQHGQAVSARNLRRLLAGSPIVASHREGDSRVQDAYSIRCTPQVHGAALDTLAHARMIAERELDAAIDNPMILPDGRVESCGNFHGAPVGFVCDFLAIAVSELCAIAERRTDRMLDVARSHGLPPFLTPDAGVNSGLMIAHYTQVAMALDAKRLAAPASVDSLPTSANQEDHVSNGWATARKLRRAVANLARVLAVELVCAGAAIDLRAPLLPGAGTGAALEVLRLKVAGPGPDRWLSPDLRAAEAMLLDGSLLRAVESAVGTLEVL
jgi:histidine ammonia-lyase